MPGLCGVVSARGHEDAARRFGTVRGRLLRHQGLSADTVSAFEGACRIGHAYMHRDAVGAAARDAGERTDDHAICAMFHGVLHNAGDLHEDLERSTSGRSLDELIAALYALRGKAFVNRLQGEYALALVDPTREHVVLATDPIGNYPLYWQANADGLIFSSDLSALLRGVSGTTRLDLRAVADYLTIGAVLGDKTLAEGVHLLQPGTVLTYDARQRHASLCSYTRLETFFQNKVADRAAYLDAVDAAFRAAVGRASTTTSQLGLSLSGGLDSRAILSALPDASRTKSYTLGVEGCADQVIAGQLAGIAGTGHVFFRLDDSYLRDFLPNMARMVSITDGMYLSHGLTEMLAIQFLDATGIGVLVRGHGGELAKAHLAWPLHTDQQVNGMTSLDELVPYLSARANYVTPNLPLSRIFTPEASAAAGDGTRTTFAHALKDTNLSPADACSYLYLRELNRRFTVPSLELFRTCVEVRLPYLDPAFLKVLLAAPSQWRDATTIHRRLIASGNSRLLKVRNSNTGASAGAGRLGEFVLDKCNTALKRLNVHGYRHYHNFDGWMRSRLLETVESELLAPAARVQAFVTKGALAELIRESREGAADRSYLLQILLILELWQRENGIEAAA